MVFFVSFLYFPLPNRRIFLDFTFVLPFRDRIRTTNNMLGDCYAAAVVEQLSKKELMALDAAAYQVRLSRESIDARKGEFNPQLSR